MGTALVTDEVPLLKSNNAILAFANNKSKVKPTRDCIIAVVVLKPVR